ncbi:EamA family transporter [Neobacillus sp. K501]
MKSSLFIMLLVIMTLFGAAGGVFFKLLSTTKKKIFFLVGGFFYGIGALLNIVLLKELPYTVVFPANALTYIWALILAKWVFNEKIGKYKLIGVVFIILGIVMLVL